MKEIKLKANAQKFHKLINNFIKKFNNLDKAILFEFDLEHKMLKTYMTNVQKSIVKYHAVSFNEILDFEGDVYKHKIYIPLFSSERLLTTLSLFEDSDIEIIINGEKDEEFDVFTALALTFNGADLKMELVASKISLFKTIYEISGIMSNIADTSNSIYSLQLPIATVAKIKNLSSTNTNEEIYFINENNDVYVRGDSFKLKIGTIEDVKTIPTYRIAISKNNIKNIDNEGFKLYVLNEKLIWISTYGKNINKIYDNIVVIASIIN